MAAQGLQGQTKWKRRRTGDGESARSGGERGRGGDRSEAERGGIITGECL